MTAIVILQCLQSCIGMDITGEAEFQLHQWREEEGRRLEAEEHEIEDRIAALQLEIQDLLASADDCKGRKGKERRRSGAQSLVSVAPSKLYFPLPLDKFILNTLTARNVTDSVIAFKMKATAPARYAVKPRHGVLGPREHVDFHITLRPTAEDPATLRDKFLIESRMLTPREIELHNRFGDASRLWLSDPCDAVGVKIRCKFTADLPARFVVKSVVDSVVAEDPVHMEAWEPDVPLLHQAQPFVKSELRMRSGRRVSREAEAVGCGSDRPLQFSSVSTVAC
jgi:uncharacterized small protein (DUF1192 family)